MLLIVVGIASNVAAGAKRFVDNGDGTITDNHRGLMWEKKTGTVGRGGDYDHPRNVNNLYTWTATTGGTAADGTLFTDFLAKMNCTVSATGGCPVGGRYRDWRIRTIAELQTILLAPHPCGTSPCIAPIFGPTAAFAYWSSTTDANYPGAWFVAFGDGLVNAAGKAAALYVRAVRGGP